MVVVRAHAFLAHPAVTSSQRHVHQALSAVSETNFNLSGGLASLDCGEVLSLSHLLDSSLASRHLHLPGVLDRDDVG